MDKGVRITGPSIKLTGLSHTPQRRCSDSYWSFGPVMNKLLLDIATCPTSLGITNQKIISGFYRSFRRIWWFNCYIRRSWGIQLSLSIRRR